MTTSELTAFIAEQRAIDQARTQGEWTHSKWRDGTNGFETVDGRMLMWVDEAGTVEDNNMDFITATSANYGKLLDALENTLAELAELKAKIDAERGKL